MKKFLCGAVVPNCDASFEADTDQEILDQVAVHAASAHQLTVLTPELIDAVRQQITTDP